MACRLVVFTLALQALQGLFIVSGSVHPGYTLRDGTSYKVFTVTKSHYQAERTCEADGGHLVDIKTESLHNFILDMVRAVNPYRLQDYWIGLNDKRTYNVWTWSDGTPLSDCGFSKWAPGEPNNGFGWGQDCGQLWAARQLRWDDDFCNILKGGCHVANGGCDQICTSDGLNTRCDCRIGYVLSDDGHNCTVYTRNCMFGNGATYRGTASMTSGNHTCQRWDSQTPHPHDQTVRHPLAGLDENYCRNPDGEPRPWCYTTDPAIRWQYCTVPQCFSDCYIDDGTSYRGTVNITSSGRACQRWDSQTPHPHTRTLTSYPSAGLDENFCRNPDGEAEPWCYTQDPYVKWEACVISKCDGRGIIPGECHNDRGVSYRGKVNVTSSGRACQRWDSQTPHQHLSTTADTFPQAGLQDNYCRNPNNDVKPWCYTTDPLTRIEFCPVPNCVYFSCMVVGNVTSNEAQKGGAMTNTGGIVAGVIVAILVVVVAVLGVTYYFLFWRKRMDDEAGLVANEGPVATTGVGFQNAMARNVQETFINPVYDLATGDQSTSSA
uniref:Plasminogen-like n=1 Tax=Branchiostoma floridae TaxID=7739 RepID=C3Y3G7_BRAFL|eukprot:XP_002609224.1 hypothetical protein BRAFLDRAFT_125972 [Branchiostoma floridae]